MAGCINDIDSVISPEAGRCSGGDGDTPFLFLNHPVHDSSPIMNFTYFVRYTGIVEDSFGSRGFPRIYVRHDANIACTF
jgi:hypothetical protein